MHFTLILISVRKWSQGCPLKLRLRTRSANAHGGQDNCPNPIFCYWPFDHLEELWINKGSFRRNYKRRSKKGEQSWIKFYVLCTTMKIVILFLSICSLFFLFPIKVLSSTKAIPSIKVPVYPRHKTIKTSHVKFFSPNKTILTKLNSSKSSNCILSFKINFLFVFFITIPFIIFFIYCYGNKYQMLISLKFSYSFEELNLLKDKESIIKILNNLIKEKFLLEKHLILP